MKRFTKGRDRIINFIGLRNAFPVLAQSTGEPAILRVGDDETGYRRVGWAEFFKAIEQRGYVFVYEDDSETFEYRFMKAADARRELGLTGSYLFKHAIETLRGLPAYQHS